jgi:LPS export ABC transporter protein LptC
MYGSRKENMNRDRLNSITFFSSAAILCCFFISGCVNDPKTIRELTEKKMMVDEAKNVVSYLSQQGKLKAKLTAPVMNRYQADTVYFDFPNSLHVDFYDDSATLESWLDSKHGKYFESLNKVYLWDSVTVINRNGDTMKSNDLWWDQNTKLFYTDKLAEYRTKSKQIMGGKGAEATQDLSAITFKQPTGHVLVNEAELSGDSAR